MNIDPCDVWGSALTAGTMTFDSTHADDCVAALQSLSCGSLAPGACSGVLVGTVPADYAGLGTGTACSVVRQLSPEGQTTPLHAILFSECVAGTFCTNSLYSGAGQCKGLCKAYASSGASCDDGNGNTGLTSNPCAPGLICDSTKHCVAGTYACPTGDCTPSAPTAGACCGSGSASCGGATYCGTDHVCHPLPILGEGCFLSPNPATQPSALCVTGVCDTTSKTCATAAPNTSCESNVDLESASCGANAICYQVSAGDFRCSSTCL
jgi:hypothetical protein